MITVPGRSAVPTTNRLIRLSGLLALLIIALGCAEARRAHESISFEQLFTLESEVTIRGTADLPLFTPTKVLAAREQYYVLDRSLRQVVVYDSNGEVVGTIGQHGWGPGELISPTTFAVSERTGSVYVYDEGPDRVSAFDYSSLFQKSIAITTPSITDLQIHTTPDGEEVIAVVGMHYKYGGSQGHAALVETLDADLEAAAAGSEPIRADGFLLHRFPATVDSDGNFFVANQLDPQLYVFDAHGTLVQIEALASPSFRPFVQSMPFRDFSTETLFAEFERLKTESYSTIEALVVMNGRLLALIEQHHPVAHDAPRFTVDVYGGAGELVAYGAAAPGRFIFGQAGRVFFGSYDESGSGALTVRGYALNSGQ